MNNKAQLGRIITIFPVMLLIFIVLGIYLITTGFAFLIKQPSVPANINSLDSKQILQKEITVNGEQTIMLNALTQFKNKAIERSSLKQGLDKLVDKENNILLIAIAENENPGNNLGGEASNNFVIKFNEEEGNFAAFHDFFSNYRKKGLLNQVSFTINNNGQLTKVYLEYYYGPCPSSERGGCLNDK